MTGRKIYIKKFGWDWVDLIDFRGQKGYTKIRSRYARIANKSHRQSGKANIREEINFQNTDENVQNYHK